MTLTWILKISSVCCELIWENNRDREKGGEASKANKNRKVNKVNTGSFRIEACTEMWSLCQSLVMEAAGPLSVSAACSEQAYQSCLIMDKGSIAIVGFKRIWSSLKMIIIHTDCNSIIFLNMSASECTGRALVYMSFEEHHGEQKVNNRWKKKKIHTNMFTAHCRITRCLKQMLCPGCAIVYLSCLVSCWF